MVFSVDMATGHTYWTQTPPRSQVQTPPPPTPAGRITKDRTAAISPRLVDKRMEREEEEGEEEEAMAMDGRAIREPGTGAVISRPRLPVAPLPMNWEGTTKLCPGLTLGEWAWQQVL